MRLNANARFCHRPSLREGAIGPDGYEPDVRVVWVYFDGEEDGEWVKLEDLVFLPSGLLPTDSESRKDLPLVAGVLDYFPAALIEVARVSKAGNDKHNPGQPLHHARGKSTDHADALLRHLMERGGFDEVAGTKLRHSAEMAWRALALLQQEIEDAGEAPLARGASTE